MADTSEHYALGEAEAEAIWFIGTMATLKGLGETGGALGLVEFTYPNGFATPRHVHHAEDEGFYVLEGRCAASAGTGGGARPAARSSGYRATSPTATPSTATRCSGRWRSPCPPASSHFVAEAGAPAGARTLPPPWRAGLREAAGGRKQAQHRDPRPTGSLARSPGGLTIRADTAYVIAAQLPERIGLRLAEAADATNSASKVRHLPRKVTGKPCL